MKKTVKPILGVIALIAASVGLILAIFGSDIAEFIEPTPIFEEKVADIAVRVKDAVIAKLKDRDAVIATQDSSFSWHETMPKAALAMSVLALIGGACSYVRGENRAFAISAAGLGVVSIAWVALMVSLGVIIVAVIIFMVLGALGIDISF